MSSRLVSSSKVLFSALIFYSVTTAAPDSSIILPRPQLDRGKPLMQVILARKSIRDFDTRELSLTDLSNLLWAGFGINRPETGGRTAPSAMNKQEIDLYVALAKGMYRYDAKAHALRLVVALDLRSLTGKQPFVKDAPCNIVFVANGNVEYAGMDAAFISENIYLYCASEDLATVVRGYFDKKALAKAMNLGTGTEVVLTQTVGYPKGK